MFTQQDRELVIASAMYDELCKIAATLSPEVIAQGVAQNLATRRANMSDWNELTSLTGRSATGGILENMKNWMGGRKVRKQAYEELAQRKRQFDPRKATSLEDQNARLAEISRIRNAEREISGVGKAKKKKSFFGSEEPAPRQGSSLRNVAFGAGLGGAGVLGAQKYLQSRQQEPQY